MTDNQKQIEFAMRWLMEFGDGPVSQDAWWDNEWYQDMSLTDEYIGAWETRGWLTDINRTATIISQASLDLLKGDSNAQQCRSARVSHALAAGVWRGTRDG